MHDDPDQRGDADAPAVPRERIAKVIARAGVCSRREAERLIAEGRVSLDGEVLTSPAVTVAAGARIRVDGAALPAAEPARLWRYHKRRGTMTTARDPQGRRTIYQDMEADTPAGALPRLQPVGRLDINSEGLLLLTNDGGLKRKLELPATGWLRRYRVRVYGRVDAEALAGLTRGITVDGITYGPVEAALEHRSGANSWLRMGLREGKNREVRRICQHLGLTVNRLIRISYGPFQLGRLKPGEIEEVAAKVLGEQLGTPAPRQSRAGFAKAKPKPRKPGTARRRKIEGDSDPGGKSGKKSAAPVKKAAPRPNRGKAGKPHAHRRRPA